MIALITAALQGLAAIPQLIDFIKSLNLDARLNALETKQQTINQGLIQIAGAKTDEDYAKALDILVRGINS